MSSWRASHDARPNGVRGGTVYLHRERVPLLQTSGAVNDVWFNGGDELFRDDRVCFA
jgi:hypothetical protein